MAGGLGNVSIDANHGANLTAAITALGVAGWVVVDYENMFNWALDTWAAACDFSNLGQVADGGTVGNPRVSPVADEGGHFA